MISESELRRRLAALREGERKGRWRVTYEIITEESAAEGDIAESGFIDPDGFRVQAIIGAPTPGVEMTLRNALRFVYPQEDCGRWLSEIDASGHFANPEGERRNSLHPPDNITAASYRRVKRLLGVK